MKLGVFVEHDSKEAHLVATLCNSVSSISTALPSSGRSHSLTFHVFTSRLSKLSSTGRRPGGSADEGGVREALLDNYANKCGNSRKFPVIPRKNEPVIHVTLQVVMGDE